MKHLSGAIIMELLLFTSSCAQDSNLSLDEKLFNDPDFKQYVKIAQTEKALIMKFRDATAIDISNPEEVSLYRSRIAALGELTKEVIQFSDNLPVNDLSYDQLIQKLNTYIDNTEYSAELKTNVKSVYSLSLSSDREQLLTKLELKFPSFVKKRNYSKIYSSKIKLRTDNQ